ncbi:MAG: hypothetical protein N3D73_02135 [Candidatus Diapherotrites archaeon]|nr:hypothetical protein [Candidatus Diapherotrites archaeon]
MPLYKGKTKKFRIIKILPPNKRQTKRRIVEVYDDHNNLLYRGKEKRKYREKTFFDSKLSQSYLFKLNEKKIGTRRKLFLKEYAKQFGEFLPKNIFIDLRDKKQVRKIVENE